MCNVTVLFLRALLSYIYTVRSYLCPVVSSVAPNTALLIFTYTLHLLVLQSTFCFITCFFILFFPLKKKILFHIHLNTPFLSWVPHFASQLFHLTAHNARQAFHSLSSSEKLCVNQNKLNDRWLVTM